MNKNTCIFLCIFTGSVLMLCSCKKTIGLEPLPKNKMTEYKVSNLADTVIYGAIDNIENTITVYVPFYYAMSVIDPEIKLEPGAMLAEEPEPVSVSDTSYKYIVKGSDGSQRIYKLIIVERSSIPLNLLWLAGIHDVTPGGGVNFIGDFASTSTSSLSVDFISRTGGDTLHYDSNGQVKITLFTGNDYPHSYILIGAIPKNADSGYYDVRIRHLGREQVMGSPLHVSYLTPGISTIWSTITIAQGGQFSLLPAGGSLFIDPVSAEANLNNTKYILTIQSSTTRSALVLKVPDNFPVGDHGNVPVTFRFGNWEPFVYNIPLTITPK